jgi:hypothetical protein
MTRGEGEKQNGPEKLLPSTYTLKRWKNSIPEYSITKEKQMS